MNAVAVLIVALVVLQRLGELWLAKRNTAALLAIPGAFETGAGHYPVMVAMHSAWLAAVGYAAWHAASIDWVWIGIFVLLQAGRVWVLATLGRFWTTRIIVVPNAPMVRRGPYRFCAHPNYVVVAGEILALPLAFGAWEIAVLFTILNAVVLWVRIRAEFAANRDRITAPAD